jgi:hypothetical protein
VSQKLPSFAREDAAYWPDTQRTPLAKEGTNGIWPANVLLHAPKLGHGTDYFTSPPKEGMLWIFPSGKNPTVGSEPAILGTRGQQANH